MHIDDKFQPLIAGYNLASFDLDPNAICGFWPDGRLAYMNNGWFSFAARNGGEPAISQRFGLGASILAVCPTPLDEFYRRLFAAAIASQDPVQHDYECSSGDHYRLYHMRIHGLAGGKGLLAIHSLIIERPHDPNERPAHEPIETIYRNANGLIKQCGNCRRFERRDIPQQWDWVPAWVQAGPPRISHGLCNFCMEIYYTDAMHGHSQ